MGLAYFRERGFNEDIIRKFGLGYSPEKRDALAQEANKQGYKTDYLLKTGLCREGQNNRIYDLFAGRVMFPVYSVSGKVVAFGGRILKSGVKSVNISILPNRTFITRAMNYMVFSKPNELSKKRNAVIW